MTEEPNISDREIEAFRRFLEHLPHGRDRELVVLKAHLLVEEQLRQLIAERVRNPDALRDARLTFAQCVSVARSFMPADHDPVLWDAVRLLNQLRNDYAHQLSPGRIDERSSRLIDKMQPNGPINPDPSVSFEFALWTLFSAVAHLVERPSARVLKLVPQ